MPAPGSGAAEGAGRRPPRPTAIAWCTRCLRAGMRHRGDPADAACRYCGGPVEHRKHPTVRRARAALAERWRRRQTRKAAGEIVETPAGGGRVNVETPWDTAAGRGRRRRQPRANALGPAGEAAGARAAAHHPRSKRRATDAPRSSPRSSGPPPATGDEAVRTAAAPPAKT